jgi:hypothetical protein
VLALGVWVLNIRRPTAAKAPSVFGTNPLSKGVESQLYVETSPWWSRTGVDKMIWL